MVLRGPSALSALSVFGLQARRQTHPLPLPLIQLTITVTVETLQQAGKVALPLTNHRPLGRRQIQALTATAVTAESADGIQRLANLQALFAVTIALAAGEQRTPASFRRTQGVTQMPLPDLPGGRTHLGPAGIDQATARAVSQAQPGFAAAAFQGAPTAVFAAGAVFLDPVAPPQAGRTGQRGAQLRLCRLLKNAVELDVALGRRTDLRGRGIEQVPGLGETPDKPPAAARGARDAACQADNLGLNLHDLAEQGLEVDVGLFRVAELQQHRLLEGEQPGDQHIGELLDTHVVEIDRLVVQLATVGNAVFQTNDALLQVLKALIGLQLRIVLRQCEQLAEAGAQTAFGLAQRAHIGLFPGTGHRLPGGDHPLQGGAFMLHILLAVLDQLGQLLMALLEQYIDIRPGLADSVLQAHQGVVEHHRVSSREDQNNDNGDAGKAHAGLPWGCGWHLCWHFSLIPDEQSGAGSRLWIKLGAATLCTKCKSFALCFGF